MNSRPQHWHQLPTVLLARLLQDVELDYCPYDSSRDEVETQIHRGPDAGFISEDNQRTMRDAYDNTSDDTLEVWIAQEIVDLQDQIEQLRNL